VEASELLLRVLPEADSDPEELAEWADQLRDEMLEADATSVALLAAQEAPGGAKGLGALVGQLAAQVATLDGLRSVVGAVRAWASRSGRTVEVSIDGDVLKIGRASEGQQEQIINAWLARHAPAS
jgi:hypothetical protein